MIQGDARRGAPGGTARKPQRRARGRGLLVLGAVLVLLGGSAWTGLPRLGRWYVERHIVPLLGKRLDRRVGVGRIVVSYQQLVLDEITLSGQSDAPGEAMARIGRLRMDYRLSALLRGRLVARQVVAEDVVLQLRRRADGSSNFLDLLTRHRLRTGSGRLRVEGLLLQGGRITARDERLGVSLSAGRLEGRLRSGEESTVVLGEVSLSSPRFSNPLTLGELGVSLRYAGGKLVCPPRVRVAGGRIQLLPHLELSGIHGRITPEADRVRILLDGSYGGSEAKLWSASGWIDPVGRLGAMKVHAARFSLGRIASILGRTPVILPQRTQIDGALDLSFAESTLHFGGQLEVKDLNLFHPRLARTPVLGLAGSARIKGQLELGAERLVVQQLDLSSREVAVKVTGLVERLSGARHLAVRLQVPPVPCQAVLDSLPPSLLPQLQGFQLKGTFAVDLRADVDYAHLDRVELGGSVGIRHCKVVRAPEAVDAARLKEPFDHQVEPSPGQPRTFTVGPENPDFVPYDEISRNMVGAVLTTEDGGFFKHRGFIPSQFRSALARNLQKGGFALGASTITMQMVKNVLLTPEKTLSRKLQELFLTWYLEGALSKERLMEIYLNVIEFGPGIYGVGAAARHYFGTPAKELTALEAAFFASLLPSPKRRYAQYCRGELTKPWEIYVRRLLRRMVEKGHVDAQAGKAAEEETLHFARDTETLGVDECQKQLKTLLDSWQEEERRRLREAIQQAAPHQLDLYLKPAPE